MLAPEKKRRGRPPLTAEQKLWRRYLVNRESIAARNELAAHYAPFVRRTADYMVAKRNIAGFCSAEELIGHGMEGLLSALARFEPERGLRFETYATPRVRGAILDGLREMDERPRLWRAQINQVRDAIEPMTQQLGRQPHVDELAAAFPGIESNIIVEALEFTYDNSLDRKQFSDLPGGHRESNRDVTVGQIVFDRQARRPCRGLRDSQVLDLLFVGLNYDERTLLFLYHIRGRTMKLIGEALGLSESRVSQLHGDLVERLRAKHRPEDLFGLLRE